MIMQLFIAFIVAGLFLIGAEIFVPGGMLGTIGGLALIGAVITGFMAFGPVGGMFASAAILILVVVTIILWLKIFPNTKLGKKITVTNDLSTAKSSMDGIENLLDKEGEASSDLRPSGYAIIDGKRVDVVTEGGMISKGQTIKVVKIDGNRVIVKQINQ